MNHTISAPRSTRCVKPDKPINIQSVLDVEDHGGDPVDRKPLSRVWWYSSNGGTQSVLIDAKIIERLHPLVRSGHIAKHMDEWLERVRNQYQNEAGNQEASQHVRRQTNWLRLCGRTKSQVIAEILIGLTDRLERGEINPAPKNRGRSVNDLASGGGDL